MQSVTAVPAPIWLPGGLYLFSNNIWYFCKFYFVFVFLLICIYSFGRKDCYIFSNLDLNTLEILSLYHNCCSQRLSTTYLAVYFCWLFCTYTSTYICTIVHVCLFSCFTIIFFLELISTLCCFCECLYFVHTWCLDAALAWRDT